MAAPYLRTRPALSAALRPLAPKPRLQSFPRRPNSTTTTTTNTTTTTTTATPTEPTKAAVADPSILPRRLKYSAYAAALAAVLGVGYYYATDTRASVHQYLVPPLLRTIYPDAEEAHHVGTAALKGLYEVGLHIRERVPEYPNGPLSVNVFGKQLLNPIGISAGLDKDAEIPDPLFALGAGVVEVGGCTPFPQEGNPKPRVFRIPSVDGLINRYGLNSRGADAMATRLRERLRKFARSVGLTENQVLNEEGTDDIPPGSLHPGRLLCVQIAKNKKTDEKDVNAVIRDYVYCVDKLAPYADVLVVNVSSPNTPGLRDLQATEPLTKLLSAVVDAAQQTKRKIKPRVMVKVSPDEDDDTQMEGVVEAVWNSGVDGVIVGNTTKRRTGIVPKGVKLIDDEPNILREEGGFSGPALFEHTASLVGRYRKMLDGYALKSESDKSAAQKVLFASGGITNGEQALKVLNAGASVAMVYTGMVYSGSGTITRIKTEMKEKLAVKSA
ncbi:Dihydroorotate dehydrogenase (quinone), mitochondrial [Neurospora sp. IMI 360204]|nr:Dihydroorotate dehydrogenase (quinone), mitochondrial [Neurospora sp. IMI 360204]